MSLPENTFLKNLDASRYLSNIFDYSDDLYFFAKDKESVFTMCNRALLDKIGLPSEKEIIGKSDFDLFEESVAEKYREEDRELFATQQPILNRVWLVPNASGKIEWYLSNKFPLFNHDGALVGLAGLMRDYERAGSILGSYEDMAEVIDYMHAHFPESIRMEDLAKLAHLSLSQFERRFKRLFKTSPVKYLNHLRIDAAAHKLKRTTDTISAIAHDCGFYDHSYFTKQFKKYKGLSPKEYRKGNSVKTGSWVEHSRKNLDVN